MASDSYTKLLLHFTGANNSTTITDDGVTGHSPQAQYNAKVSTTQYKFGLSSLYLDGVDDKVTVPDSSDWYFSNGNFTIDFWFRHDGLALGSRCAFFSIYTDSNNRIHFECYYPSVERGKVFTFSVLSSGTSIPGFSVENLAWNDATWVHVALVRNATNSLMLFLNGVLSHTQTNPGTYPDLAADLTIGWYGNNAWAFKGYIDEFRVSKGIARWTSNFTPPTDMYDRTYLTASLAESQAVSDGQNNIFRRNVAIAEVPASVSALTGEMTAQSGTIAEVVNQTAVYDYLFDLRERSIAESITATELFHALLQNEQEASISEMITASVVLTGLPDFLLASIAEIAEVVSEIGVVATFIAQDVFDSIYIKDTSSYQLWLSLTEALGLDDSAAAMLCLMIHDYLVALETQTVNQSGTKAISEGLTLSDAAYPALHLSIADAVGITDTTTVQLCIGILEHLWFNELVTAIGTLNHVVADSVTAIDSVQFGFSQAVSSALSVVDVASIIGALVNSIAESLVAADAATPQLTMPVPVTDSLTLTDTVSSQGILYNIIYDTLHLGVTVELDGETWECYVLNTPRFLPSIYSGFNFNSYCVFENRAYGCKVDGIYELTGDTDNGVAFHTGVQLSETTFGVPNQKRFRKAYVGVSGTSPVMTMETEDGEKTTYTIDADGEVDASRALRSKKWKLTITDFNSLDFVKLYPVVLAK